MKVSIDRSKCLGNGHCLIEAPEVFDQDDDGLVVLLNDAPYPDQEARVIEAARQCPVQAIALNR